MFSGKRNAMGLSFECGTGVEKGIMTIVAAKLKFVVG